MKSQVAIALKTLWTSFRDPVYTDRTNYFTTQKFSLWDWPKFTAPLFIVKLLIRPNYVKVEEYQSPRSLTGKPANRFLRAACPAERLACLVLTPVTHMSCSQSLRAVRQQSSAS